MKLLGGILVSLRPSVCPSVHLSVHFASFVCSVVPTVLVGSISYLYNWSSNFRRCVMCKVSCQISKFECLAICSCDQAALRTLRPIWGRQDQGGHHVGHMNFAISVLMIASWYISTDGSEWFQKPNYKYIINWACWLWFQKWKYTNTSFSLFQLYMS